MTKKKKNPVRVEEGSGNVCADLGFAHPEQEQLKADLTLQIYRTIKQGGSRRRRQAKSSASDNPMCPA